MEQTEVKKESKDQSGNVNYTMAAAPSPKIMRVPKSLHRPAQYLSVKHQEKVAAGACSMAVGLIHTYMRWQNRGAFSHHGSRKEFVQATGRTGKETAGLTNQKTFHSVLSKPENRYLVRKMCWVWPLRVLIPTFSSPVTLLISIHWWKLSVLLPVTWTLMWSSV